MGSGREDVNFSGLDLGYGRSPFIFKASNPDPIQFGSKNYFALRTGQTSI